MLSKKYKDKDKDKDKDKGKDKGNFCSKAGLQADPALENEFHKKSWVEAVRFLQVASGDPD